MLNILIAFCNKKKFSIERNAILKTLRKIFRGHVQEVLYLKAKDISNVIGSKIIKRKQVNEVFLLTLLLSLNKFYAFLWHLQKQPPEVVYTKKFSLKNLQNSQENTCASVPFLIKLQTGKNMSSLESKIQLAPIFIHFISPFSFYTPWKHQKTRVFLILLGNIERTVA